MKSPLRQSQPTAVQSDRMATRSSPRKQGQAQQQQQASTSLGLPSGMDSLPSDTLFQKSDFGMCLSIYQSEPVLFFSLKILGCLSSGFISCQVVLYVLNKKIVQEKRYFCFI